MEGRWIYSKSMIERRWIYSKGMMERRWIYSKGDKEKILEQITTETHLVGLFE